MPHVLWFLPKLIFLFFSIYIVSSHKVCFSFPHFFSLNSFFFLIFLHYPFSISLRIYLLMYFHFKFPLLYWSASFFFSAPIRIFPLSFFYLIHYTFIFFSLSTSQASHFFLGGGFAHFSSQYQFTIFLCLKFPCFPLFFFRSRAL